MDKTIQPLGGHRESENTGLQSPATLLEEIRQRANELERKSKRLEVLNSLNTQISLLLTLGDVLQLALVQGLEAIGAADGSIMLLDPMTGDLEIQAWLVDGKFIADKSHRKLHLGEGIAGHVAETGRPYNCPDTLRDKLVVESFTGRKFGSLLCVPILSNGGVVGTISADSQHTDFFQEDDVQFLSGLGGQIAAAIEMQRLREIGTALATLSLAEILDKVVESAALLAGAEFCTMFLPDEKTGELIRARNFPPSRKTSKGPRSEGLSAQVMKSGKAIVIQDAQNDSRVKQESKDQGIQAILGVPLKVRSHHKSAAEFKTVGVLFVNTRKKREFNTRHVEILESLANQAALAIENARLFEERKRAYEVASARANALGRLNEVGNALASTLDLEKLLHLIVRFGAEILNAEVCQAFLVKREGFLSLEASFGHVEKEFPRGLELEITSGVKTGLTGHVAWLGEVVSLHGEELASHPAVKNSDPHAHVPSGYCTSFLAIPLKRRSGQTEQVIGLIKAENKKNQFGVTDPSLCFDEQDILILKRLASYAETALQNVQLYEKAAWERSLSENRARQLLALQDVTREMQSEFDLERLLALISKKAAELLGADAGGILLFDDERKHLTFSSAYGLSERMVKGTCDEVGTSISGRVVEDGKPILANDIPNDPRFYNPAAEGEGILAIASTPLFVDGQVIGTLDIHSKSNPRAFDEGHLQILSLMANQAAVAIENARLLAETRQQFAMLSKLYDASRILTATHDTEQVLDHIASLAGDAVDSDFTRVVLLQGDGLWKGAQGYGMERQPLGREKNSSWHHEEGRLWKGVKEFWKITRFAVQARENGTTRYTLNKKKPVLFDQVRSDGLITEPLLVEAGVTTHNPSLIEQGIKSYAGIPLIVKERMLGALFVHSRRDHAFRDRKQLLTAFANQAAIAIENARLFDETRRRTIAFQTLHQTGLELTRYKPVPQLVKTILRRAVELLHATGGGLNLLEKSGDRYKLAAVWNLREDFVGRTWELSEGIVGAVIRRREPLFVPDYPNWGKRLTDYDGYPIEGVASAPIAWQDKMWGAIAIYTNDRQRSFDQEDLTLLGHFGNLAALALENARGTDELQQVMSSTADAIVAVDGHGMVTSFNEQAEKILGYSAQEIIGRSVTELYYERDEPWRVQQMLERGGGKITEYDTFVKSKTGERIPIRLSASLLFDYNGKLIGSVGFFRDLRELDSAHREIDRLKHLLQAGQAITELHDLPRVLDTIVDMTLEALHADTVSLFRYDREKDEIYPAPIQRGLIHENAASLDVGPDSIVRKIISESAMHFAENAGADKLFRGDFIQREGIRSSAAIPLQVRDANVGVLFCNYRRPHPFTDQEQAVIPLFANQAAIAIENARLYEETQHRAKQFETLYQVGLDLTAELTREVVLQSVVDHALDLTNAKYGALSILGSDKKVELFITSGLGPLRHEGLEGPPQGLGVLGDLLQEAQLIRLADIRKHPNFRDFPPHHPIIASFLGISITSKGRIIGSLYVGNKRGASEFSLDDGKAIALLGAQVAVAVENMRLFEAEQQRIRRLEAIRSVSRAANSTLELQEIYQKSIAAMIEVFDLDQGGVVIFDYKQGYASTEAEYPQVREPRIQIPIAGNSSIEWILQEKVPLPLQDAANDPRLYLIQEAIRQWGVKSTLLLPLIVKDKVIGTLGLDAVRAPREFTPDEIDLAQTLANSVAIAISNAQAFRELDQRERHLQAVYETGLATLGTLDRKDMFEKILRQAAERVAVAIGENASFAMMQEHDPETDELVLTTVYPPAISSKLSVRIGERLSLEANSESSPIGIPARAAREKRALLVEDVNNEPDYISYNPETRSELAVPILDGDRLLGVLNVEHNKPYAFDEHDKRAFSQLTGLIAVAMKNQEQATKLASTTWTAALGIWGAEIAHDVNREVGAIRRSLKILEQRSDLPEEAKARLRETDRWSEALLLPMETGSSAIALLDEAIAIEITQARERWTQLDWKMEFDDSHARVKIGVWWLRRIIRHLLHNSASAIPAQKRIREVIVRTRCQGHTAFLQVEDTGNGLPFEFERLAFRRPIMNEEHVGMGLLLVGSTLGQYDGSARILWNRPGEGLCLELSLPRYED